jgi:hypothetical protein
MAAQNARRAIRRLPYRRMDEQQTLNHIDELVKEEDELLHRHEGDGLSPEEHARLKDLKVQLDEAWDYLRQRRSLKQYGFDPEDASLRGPNTVENYEG